MAIRRRLRGEEEVGSKSDPRELQKAFDREREPDGVIKLHGRPISRYWLAR